jgi:hypothetical protein
MSTDDDTTDRDRDELMRRHCVSSELKQMGFRYGAPIHSAAAEFTQQDLQKALFSELEQPDLAFGYEISSVTFTVNDTGERFSIHVVSVSSCAFIQVYPLWEYLFPHLSDKAGEDASYYIVEGVLLRQDNGEIAEPLVMSQLGSHHRLDKSRTSQLVPDSECNLTVIAVVGFAEDGTAVATILQKVPSTVDQFLVLPPPPTAPH